MSEDLTQLHLVGMITDFGLTDSYVSEMHAVLHSLTVANFRIIDISHSLSPGDIKSAAYLLGRTIKFLPDESIFVAVVDPGVGTERQAVVIKSSNKYFIGPDNGIFARVIDWNSDFTVRVCHRENQPNHSWSKIFDGRDLFVPLAGQLLNGRDINDLGVKGQLLDTFPPSPSYQSGSEIHGEVVYIDRFGNISTNIKNGLSGTVIFVDGEGIKRSQSYAEQSIGELIWLYGSDGCLEVAINGQSAAKKLNVKLGDRIVLKLIT